MAYDRDLSRPSLDMTSDRLDVGFKDVESGLVEPKRKMRREVEKSGIPYTVVVAGVSLANGVGLSPPRDRVTIWVDGSAKAILNYEGDIATFTITAIDDPRAAKKFVHIRPKENIVSQGETVALWEKKIGRTLKKTVVSEEETIKVIEETPFPGNISHFIRYFAFVQGVLTSFQLNSNDVEAAEFFPDVEVKTVSAYLDQFV